MRPSDPKALIRTGVVKPATFSKSRARFRSPGPFDTRSVISAISRSRDTGALTRRSWPRLSRSAMNSRRSAKATGAARLLVVVELHQPTRDDGEGAARQHSDRDEAPTHEWRLPRDDALHAEERPRRHVGDQRPERHARVGENNE